MVAGLAGLCVGGGGRSVAHADPSSGVDTALFRASYDTSGIFALEGARLMPKRDISWKVLLSYANSPVNIAVPGIGTTAGDTTKDSVLSYLTTLDMAFGMSLSERVAIGFDVAAYRTATAAGYGSRGLYTVGGTSAKRSTGLISLRPLSNIDQSANPNDTSAYLGDGLAGPLDVRVGAKYMLVSKTKLAITAIGSVFLPFGEDQMLLGDKNLVFEPKLALDYRFDQVRASKIVFNLAGRFRQRTVLQAYDTLDPMATNKDAKAILDVGSEVVAGVGALYELTPRAVIGLEAQAFVPLPDSATYGDCRLFDSKKCSTLTSSDYYAGAKHGDLAGQATLGMFLRLNPHVSANLMIGTGALGGARGEDFRMTTGVVWSPQPAGVAEVGHGDRDGDGIPDNLDACPDEAEDKDGFQDDDGCPDLDNDGDGIPDVSDACPDEPEDRDGFQDSDGCPDRDNDGDGIPDAADKCPDQAEDFDGFEDEDGCPDEDNDGDGFADKVDKCPNDPETVNGFEDDDGCPDTRGSTGPEERAGNIDLKGGQITFLKGGTTLTPQAKTLLGQVATIIKGKRLAIRVEVHVPLGTKSKNPAQINAQKKPDKQLATRRALAILEYLTSQGAPDSLIVAVGIGSDRPLGSATPTDAINERVDFIKAQQGTP
jgi:outer membrane protein OmpA-like peptidoglycan-associated protein